MGMPEECRNNNNNNTDNRLPSRRTDGGKTLGDLFTCGTPGFYFRVKKLYRSLN